MRLLDTQSLRLCEFFGEEIPLYAILSHRWDESEVTLQELSEGRGPERAGWAKVAGYCAKAKSDGWRYVWIDSCCIDKTSSAELSEAINSMFNWYSQAQVCYAYLSDITTSFQNPYPPSSEFRNSQWFTRGWTLQELLAPKTVEFYDRNWVEIGTKSSLADLLTSITGISHLFNFRGASVAQKMSWASRRVTKRVEDEAYCLLGIFEINMTPLYGEGKNAFQRLQLEILNKTTDESLFAWAFPDDAKDFGNGSLLADSARAFQRCGDIVVNTYDENRPPHRMTNKGLFVEWLVLPGHRLSPMEDPNSYFMAPLNCSHSSRTIEYYITISLFDKQGNCKRLRNPSYIDATTIANASSSPRRAMYFQTKSSSLSSIPESYNPVATTNIDFMSMESHGFSLFTGYTSSSSPHAGMRWEHGTKLQDILISRSTLHSYNIGENYGAILFRGSPLRFRFSVMFGLIIGFTENTKDGNWIGLFNFSEDLSVESTLEQIRSRHAGVANSPDRISHRLQDGRYASASFKTLVKGQFGVQLFRVEIMISTEARWPSRVEEQRSRLGVSLNAPSSNEGIMTRYPDL